MSILAQTDTTDNAFTAFLIKAKIETYASGAESQVLKQKDGAKDIYYSDQDFKYRDRYYGELNFSGQEMVWKNDSAYWSMNYFGITDTEIQFPLNFPEFLKEALRKVPKEHPYRGPKYYESGDFRYVNEITGTLGNFHGVEKILYKDFVIYKLYYYGGYIDR
jgi:hypothetical protein